MKSRAYIDIETTGLSRYCAELTVIGIAVERGSKTDVIQLFEQDLCEPKIIEVLQRADEIYSYNGSRFDLPFIRAKLSIDIRRLFKHRDLMYDCWRFGLKGGLKAVERQLGIGRVLRNVDGYAAVKLWYEYVNNGDTEALETLLAYNREDVVNLPILRRKLGVK